MNQVNLLSNCELPTAYLSNEFSKINTLLSKYEANKIFYNVK